jgi:hypothetical protein
MAAATLSLIDQKIGEKYGLIASFMRMEIYYKNCKIQGE